LALLVAEPYGTFGALNPTGHAAIYLARVCAETPTSLRRCGPEENGVVISRYDRVAGYDWVAIPLMPYLYGVERAEDVPDFVDRAGVAHIRDAYRRKYLRELAPDDPQREIPKGHWIQLIGASYDRAIHGYALETTPEEDDRLIEYLNSKPNKRRFHLLFRNCADFARGIVNFYYPGAVRRNLIADLGISTPKQSAKALVKYAKRHDDLELSYFTVPQIAGVPPSRKVRGVAEALIRSKKYVVPLVVLQPWVAATALGAYLTSGRFDPTRLAETTCTPESLGECTRARGLVAVQATPPVSGTSGKVEGVLEVGQ
jgi:hypothetical protein